MQDISVRSGMTARNFRIGRIVVPFLLLIAPRLAAAQDAGDAVAGRQLAEKWCTTCHVVTTTQSQATSTGAPPFRTIAAHKAMTPMALRAFLQTPHHRMPDLHLTRNEIDDVAAYIYTLRQPEPEKRRSP